MLSVIWICGAIKCKGPLWLYLYATCSFNYGLYFNKRVVTDIEMIKYQNLL